MVLVFPPCICEVIRKHGVYVQFPCTTVMYFMLHVLSCNVGGAVYACCYQQHKYLLLDIQDSNSYFYL